MDGLSASLLLTAAGVGLVHTLLGPDHYLPFVMLARARNWSGARTLAITAACGMAHVLSSILLGVLGLLLGIAVSRIEAFESARGDWAAWLLFLFGLSYALWGVRMALRKSAEITPHQHANHVHIHRHGISQHGHSSLELSKSTTFWTLMIVFVLGPCEPLIPLFVLPASRGRWDLAIATGVVFGVVTILTMLAITAMGLTGIRKLSLGPLERWTHTLAGASLALAGLAVLTLGL